VLAIIIIIPSVKNNMQIRKYNQVLDSINKK